MAAGLPRYSRMKRKLLIATDNFLPRWDGIARFLWEVIPSLMDEYEITVVAPRHKGEVANLPEIRMVWIGLLPFRIGDFIPARFAWKTISQEVDNADLVWIQTIGPIGSTAIRASHKKGKPLIAFAHSIEWELVPNALSSRYFRKKIAYHLTKRLAAGLYSKCHLIMVPTYEVIKKFEWAGIRTAHVLVHLGTNPEHFVPPSSKVQAKEELGINPSHTVIGYHGRLAREKDLYTLYRAFQRLLYSHKEVTLLIVGDGIEEQKRLFKDKPQIIYAGQQNDVVPYLQAMDIFVLPSLTETTSLSTLEAMSVGLACVVTKVGYVQKYIREKKNGLFFPKRNSLVLSLKLEWLLKDPFLRRRLGDEARKTVVEKFSWKTTVRRVKEVLGRF